MMKRTPAILAILVGICGSECRLPQVFGNDSTQAAMWSENDAERTISKWPNAKTLEEFDHLSSQEGLHAIIDPAGAAYRLVLKTDSDLANKIKVYAIVATDKGAPQLVDDFYDRIKQVAAKAIINKTEPDENIPQIVFDCLDAKFNVILSLDNQGNLQYTTTNAATQPSNSTSTSRP